MKGIGPNGEERTDDDREGSTRRFTVRTVDLVIVGHHPRCVGCRLHLRTISPGHTRTIFPGHSIPEQFSQAIPASVRNGCSALIGRESRA